MATESDKVNSGALMTMVVVGTFSMIGVCLGVNALVRNEVNAMTAERAAPAERPVRDLQAEQLGKLNAPAAWADKGKGLVALPVERAMEVVVAELARDPSSATPPQPVQADAGAAVVTDAELADAGVNPQAEPEPAPDGAAKDETGKSADGKPAPATGSPAGIASSAPTAAAPPVPRPPAPGTVGPAPTPKPTPPAPPASPTPAAPSTPPSQ